MDANALYAAFDDLTQGTEGKDDVYAGVVAAAKSPTPGLRQLSAQLAATFAGSFPSQCDAAFDALVAMAKSDAEQQVRLQALQHLPKLAEAPALKPEQHQALCEMLLETSHSEGDGKRMERAVATKSLRQLLHTSASSVLQGMFAAVAAGGPARATAFQFFQHLLEAGTLASFSADTETLIAAGVAKSVADASKEEFNTLMAMLKALKSISTEAAQGVLDALGMLAGGLDPADSDSVDRYLSSSSKALELCKGHAASMAPFLAVLARDVLPVLDGLPAEEPSTLLLLRNFAEFSAHPLDAASAAPLIEPTVAALMKLCPSEEEAAAVAAAAAEDKAADKAEEDKAAGGEEDKEEAAAADTDKAKKAKKPLPDLNLSFMECLLYALHKACVAAPPDHLTAAAPATLETLRAGLARAAPVVDEYLVTLNRTLRALRGRAHVDEAVAGQLAAGLAITRCISELSQAFQRDPLDLAACHPRPSWQAESVRPAAGSGRSWAKRERELYQPGRKRGRGPPGARGKRGRGGGGWAARGGRK